MSPEKDLRDRLRELESQAAFQEESQARLSDVVARQDRDIARLEAQVQELARRLEEVGQSLPGDTGQREEEPPPHY